MISNITLRFDQNLNIVLKLRDVVHKFAHQVNYFRKVITSYVYALYTYMTSFMAAINTGTNAEQISNNSISSSMSGT